MRKAGPLAFAAVMLSATAACSESMELSPNGSRPTSMAPSDHFAGLVMLEPLFGAKAALPATGGLVTFAPGAHSGWHSHPAGQLLIVTAGSGWIQEEGGPKRAIKPGDVIWTPPGVKHWHCATPTSSLTHIAITNMVNGKNTDWLEKVTDEQYRQ